ncbi:MAG: ThuA domain-containing protein [Croceitalea sp.]|nr:ThuA domain-containing protein [Croceitalea sp.]MBT8239310.1 ThuA domain-containing protein [Croceitalea sp.]NNC34009.1 ThuA domain-containing protein [Croceitalea sp.]NNL09692.1 ThuA domain-containing protein [Croceitalea sp.]NNM17964.1 ThuA domain-containing protein [Croceitalea sp.]
MKVFQTVFILLCCAGLTMQGQAYQEPPLTNDEVIPELVLVFSKTAGYRHQSIEKGATTLRKIGRENGFIVLQTETSEDFNAKNLKNYKLVIFLSTTLDVLNAAQQKAFENYIKNGGSFMGIHAAADTEYDWAWYGKLVGGYFESHPSDPNVLKAKIDVVSKEHPSTSHLGDTWTRNDEWYNYKNLNPKMTVLLNLDETSYQGGTNGANHPIAWYHEFDGGRAYYTGGGHTEESFDEPDFKKHLLGAIEWCLGRSQ